MAKQRVTQALESLLRSALRLDRNLSVKDRFWLWRTSLISRPATSSSQAGFILPTVTLLLLMLSLVLGVLIFRTSNRTNQVIGERQQRQIYNAATPAIERAKAKLEVLFTKDIQTVTSDDIIAAPLKTKGSYKLDDETQLDVNDDGAPDAAWRFNYDSQGLTGSSGDNASDDVTVVYSILTRASQGTVSLESDDIQKAKNLVVRNGPINLTDSAKCDLNTGGRKASDDGWQKVGSTRRKAIQVHAIAIPGPNNPNKTIATLEMQQDKQGNVGNKWGAWFRNDMEIFPGPVFRWNGALNTGGSYFVRSDRANGKFKLSLYPISDPDSCVATKENSVMVMPLILDEDKEDLNDGQTYQGQLIVGSLRDNTVDAVATGGVRLFGEEAEYPVVGGAAGALTRTTDSTTITARPIELALDPVALLTEGLSRRRDGADLNQDDDPDFKRAGDWEGRPWVADGRVLNNYEKTPFVDDTYRADNRWGPKPVYREKENAITKIETPRTTAAEPVKPDYSLLISDPDTNAIPPSQAPNDQSDELTRLEPLDTQGDDEISYGLDGYWERRSRTQGVRIIVGQRLELGNAHGWKTEIDANNNGNMTDAGDVDLNKNGLLDFDPLYPPPANPGRVTQAGNTIDGSMATRQNELMQWKTLRNNPAAAQTTAVYHYLMDDGKYPTACLASAAHPGTKKSIEASTTFTQLPGRTVSMPKVSFLTGEGTNGWEFAPYGAAPYADNTTVGSALTTGQLKSAHTAFATAVDSDTSPLRIALSNLAYFSGDLAGAFPAFQDSPSENAADSDKFRTSNEQDDSVGPKTHPYPILTMWGDYSNLRRVIKKLEPLSEGGDDANYGDLSLADQTTLQTASCTLGILAYNIETETAGTAALARGAASALHRQLNALNDKNRTNGEIEVANGQISVWKVGSPATGGTALYTASATNPTPADVPPEVIAEVFAEALPSIKDQLLALQRKEQINRDRRAGFNTTGLVYTMKHNQLGGVLGMPVNLKGKPVPGIQCDFDGNKYFNQGKPRRVVDEQKFLTLAYAICPRSAKYPSLYYLFPKEDHDHIGTGTKFEQPTTEPYTSSNLTLNGAEFDNRYAFNRANNRGANVGEKRFRVVAAAGSCVTDCSSLKDIALVPKTQTAWALPNETGDSGSNVITNNGTKVSVAMLDKGIFNGREHMGVRVLDLDLDLLRNASITGDGDYKDTDFWLPLPQLIKPEQDTSIITGALIYAFREDAMREDGIARPRTISPAADDWKTKWREYSLGTRLGGYVMKAAEFNTSTEQDPPVNPVNGISPKPVDFFADPARRPNGFRLRNGIDLTRPGNDDEEDPRGLSFISDNSVYIQDDFNVHSSDGTTANRLEEFKGTSKLADDWSNFYDRAEADLNEDFARPKEDRWRTSEIISDAINVLSGNFKDGWISQGIAQTATDTSYSSLNYPIGVAQNKLLGADGRLFNENENVSLKISQRGLPVYCSIALTAGEYCLDKPDGKEVEFGLQTPTETFLEFKENKDTTRKLQKVPANNQNFVNSLILSGITPSRVGQANGGLHNFLRLNENWDEKPLWFSGSLFQLNFSHTATANYDQEAWEPDTTTTPQGGFELGREQDEYFSPPDRRWGYDVALLYVQPSPVAQRFNRLSNIRSEFYQELPVDDPYIKNLRCAEENGQKVDPNAACN